MGSGIETRQHEECLVQLGTQQLDAVVPVLGKLALHRREAHAHAARRGRRERYPGACGMGVKVRQPGEERLVPEEVADEEILEEKADAVEPDRVPPAHLAGSGEEHRASPYGMALPIEPEPSLAAGDEDDVVEGE